MNKKWGQTMDSAPKEQVSKGKKGTKEKPTARGTWLRAGALVLLLGAAGALLWGGGFQGLMNKIGGENPSPGGLEGLLEGGKALLEPAPSPTPKAGDLGAQRTLREVAYQEDREALSALSQNPEVAEKTREDAAAQLALMVASHQAELGIEEALQAAGFEPCLVLLQNGALTVMVRSESLTSAQSATILSLCAAHAQVGVENIRIMTGS